MKRRFGLTLVSLILALCVLLPGWVALAEGTAYVDADGAVKTVDSATAVTNQTEWKSGWYAVNGDVTINNQIHVDGSVHLILADGCKLTAKNGITVFRNNTLTIYGQSAGTGQLESTGAGKGQKYLYAAGIGGSSERDSGTVIINGGRITAKGCAVQDFVWDGGGAGIGGGDQSGNGTVIINGGVVNAMGGNCSAGIAAIIAAVVLAAALIPILLGPVSRTFKISSAVVSCIIGVASYFHVKHLMIPDVDYGVVRCLRAYNVLAAALSLLSMLELIALAWDLDVLLYGSGVGLCTVTLALVPTMDKGVKKWQT